jgi:transposase
VRKRHIVVDVLGRLLVVLVHSAGLQDREGAKQVLTALVARFPGLQLIWADGGDAGTLVAWVTTVLQRTLVIVKRPRHTQGFQVRQWRWIVECTFGWLNRSRRLSKDFEALPETTETVDQNRHDSPDGEASRCQRMTFSDRLSGTEDCEVLSSRKHAASIGEHGLRTAVC